MMRPCRSGCGVLDDRAIIGRRLRPLWRACGSFVHPPRLHHPGNGGAQRGSQIDGPRGDLHCLSSSAAEPVRRLQLVSAHGDVELRQPGRRGANGGDSHQLSKGRKAGIGGSGGAAAEEQKQGGGGQRGGAEGSSGGKQRGATMRLEEGSGAEEQNQQRGEAVAEGSSTIREANGREACQLRTGRGG